MELRYAQLSADPGRGLDRLIAFIDVDPDPGLRARAARAITADPAPAPSAEERRAADAIAGDLLGELGYG